MRFSNFINIILTNREDIGIQIGWTLPTFALSGVLIAHFHKVLYSDGTLCFVLLIGNKLRVFDGLVRRLSTSKVPMGITRRRSTSTILAGSGHLTRSKGIRFYHLEKLSRGSTTLRFLGHWPRSAASLVDLEDFRALRVLCRLTNWNALYDLFAECRERIMG